jgi:non-heme Fe2+,alpha-ketoglutarate-dependent halogenase
MPNGAATRWSDQYHRNGYYGPLPVLSADEARACRAHLEAFEAAHGPLQDDLRHHAHVFLVWLHELVRHARILDAVETILGESLLVWSSTIFIKEGRDGGHVPWHQDSRAFGRRAPNVLTAWVALTNSTAENGALEVLPGSHRRGELTHVKRHVDDNLLTRRPEIALGVDATAAIVVTLRAGEMSLHHPSLVHGSQRNRTDSRRIGVAIRYVRPDGRRPIGGRQPALLVRGVDADSAFVPLPRPERDAAPEALARHAELMRRPDPTVRIDAESWPRAITLRGSLLSREGQGLLLCGSPGPEMSALAGALARRGWTPVNDGLEGEASDPLAGSGGGSPGGPAGSDARNRVLLAAILLLDRSRAGTAGLRPVALPAAHALFALVRYRRDADGIDLPRGVHALEPLATAVPLLECPSASDGTIDAVERLVATAPERSPSDARSSRIWAQVEARPAGLPALQTGSTMEAML